ncbi:MAG: SDR family oxidoreductase [Nannocystaceae bacterium]|nr:SDR family oxidoreductase [Nannocystaceae bacterium]
MAATPNPDAARPLALVTGASRGIGAAIAVALAPRCDLLLTARTREALADTAAAARHAGAHVVAELAASLDHAAGREALLAALQQHAPEGVDVLVCNAGVAPSAPLHRTDDAIWSEVLAVNLEAPFVLSRALVPKMARRGRGRVVFVASTAALKGYRYTAAYSASKGGVVALMRALAAEYADKGVTINAVCPGFVDTDIVKHAAAHIATRTGKDEATARAELARFSPLQRLVTPEEVAALVAFLVGDAAATIHGQAIAQDGGETTL